MPWAAFCRSRSSTGDPSTANRTPEPAVLTVHQPRCGSTLLGRRREERLHGLRDLAAFAFRAADLLLLVLADPQDQTEFLATLLTTVLVGRHKNTRCLPVSSLEAECRKKWLGAQGVVGPVCRPTAWSISLPGLRPLFKLEPSLEAFVPYDVAHRSTVLGGQRTAVIWRMCRCSSTSASASVSAPVMVS